MRRRKTTSVSAWAVKIGPVQYAEARLIIIKAAIPTSSIASTAIAPGVSAGILWQVLAPKLMQPGPLSVSVAVPLYPVLTSNR